MIFDDNGRPNRVEDSSENPIKHCGALPGCIAPANSQQELQEKNERERPTSVTIPNALMTTFCRPDSKLHRSLIGTVRLRGTAWTKTMSSGLLRGEGPDANNAGNPDAVREAQETLLNDLGKQGWVLVSQTDGRVFYFMRTAR